MTLTELDEKARADYDARYPYGWRISYEPEGIVIRFVMPRPEEAKKEKQDAKQN